MSNEQQPWETSCTVGPSPLICQSSVVESRDDRLARARSGNHQVAQAVVDLPLTTKVIQHLLLEWIRVEVERQ